MGVLPGHEVPILTTSRSVQSTLALRTPRYYEVGNTRYYGQNPALPLAEVIENTRTANYVLRVSAIYNES